VLAGALDYLGERRQLLWDIAEAYRVAKRPRELPVKSPDEQATLAPMDANTRLAASFAATGVALEAHLTELRRDAFTRAGAKPIQELAQMRSGQAVTIGGLVVALQRPPTANGYCFLAVEDPGAMVNYRAASGAALASRHRLRFALPRGGVGRSNRRNCFGPVCSSAF
jgi:DNA polymerase III alpha subunit